MDYFKYEQDKEHGIGKLYVNGVRVPNLVSVEINVKTNSDKVAYPTLVYKYIHNEKLIKKRIVGQIEATVYERSLRPNG